MKTFCQFIIRLHSSISLFRQNESKLNTGGSIIQRCVANQDDEHCRKTVRISLIVQITRTMLVNYWSKKEAFVQIINLLFYRRSNIGLNCSWTQSLHTQTRFRPSKIWKNEKIQRKISSFFSKKSSEIAKPSDYLCPILLNISVRSKVHFDSHLVLLSPLQFRKGFFCQQ